MRRAQSVLVPLFLVLIVVAAGCLGTATQSATEGEDQESGAPIYRFSDTHVFDGPYDLSKYPEPFAPPTFEILPAEVTKLKSKLDGVDIDIGWARPKVDAATRVPVIAVASPYNSPLPPDLILRSGLGGNFSKTFITRGYAYAIVSVRGTGDSGGCMDFMGKREVADMDQAVTFLGEQPWSNGNVALIGVSYDGSTPWEPASTGNPHLKTIVPIAGINDYYQMNYRNGTPTVFGLGTETEGYYLIPAATSPTSGASPTNIVSQAVCPESWKGAYAGAHSATMGERDPLGFWAERNLRPAILKNYKGSVFMVHGFWDDNVPPTQAYPFLEQLAEQGVVLKQLHGQWGHNYPASRSATTPALRPDFHEILWRWFEHELNGRTDLDLGPVAQVQDSSGDWHSENAWPPSDATLTTFYLAPGGGLETAPTNTKGSDLVTMRLPAEQRSGYAPADLWYRPDATVCASCPTFSTAPFAQDFRFAGLPWVHLSVTALGPGGYVAAHLYAKDAAGKLTYLGQGGGIDLRFADGSEAPKTVSPQETLLAKMELDPMDAVVPAGSSLVLVLHQGGWGDHVPPPIDNFPIQVNLGGEQSRLMVRSFERGSDAFFVPPRAS
jgi:predicted acyl esterase